VRIAQTSCSQAPLSGTVNNVEIVDKPGEDYKCSVIIPPDDLIFVIIQPDDNLYVMIQPILQRNVII
jgi:hypothetical protein